MNISIITVFPELYQQFISTSLISRAIENGTISCNFVKFSDLVDPKVRIDEPTCGPGAGMIIKPELIEQAIKQCEDKWGKGYKVFFSPQGKKLNQNRLKLIAEKLDLASKQEDASKSDDKQGHLILVCTRYEGIDERVEKQCADLVLSIGDYVLMGGDLPAQVFLEGLLRLSPGIVGKAASVEKESFSGPFLDHPEFGLPAEWNGMEIPEVVLSGNHGKSEEWRAEQSAHKTVRNRFDWFRSNNPSDEDISVAKKHIPNHYVALMHTQIMIKGGRIGESSIASLDIHDIARSSRTYGLENYFIVSPLKDQQEIMRTFLKFWHSDAGKEYNKSRYDAVERIVPAINFEDVVQKITEKEGVKPLVIATSAKKNSHSKIIDYSSQSIVWKHNRPVLLLLGTAQGLAQEIIDQTDYLLVPIEGMTNYNHLSVRAAAAIIFDRWLGLQPKTSSNGIDK